jgi:ABC-2 type transport system ATP-binding protein
MGPITIEAERLTKRFGTRVAAEDLSFTARQGEVMGLLGPNGAGKTTTIRLLTTVLKPTSGRFAVTGIGPDRPNEIRRRVGVLPESAGYPQHQTGRDYLRYHARLFGLPRSDAERVAERLLADVGLQDRATSQISTYSRGMRQRLGIARALVNDPVVVLLDEPTLGLDPAGQRHVLGILRDIAQRRGATVVLSTHTLPEVEQVCTSVLILDKGRVVISGSVAEVTRVVGSQLSGSLRVPIELIGKARRALASVPGLSVQVLDERADVLSISLTAAAHEDHSNSGMNAALRAVLGADIQVLSFEVDGVRLTDAFLAITRKDVT